MKIKPNTTGVFYPERKKQLLRLFNSYSRQQRNLNSRLVIVPHAGYEFSGKIAYDTYVSLNKNVSNIIIIAPAVYSQIYGSVTCNAESFKTPLNDILIKPYDNMEVDNEIFESEPALSVQLPFIKHFYPEATVTPILYGCEDYKKITEIIDKNIDKSVIVIVSNLSRFIPEKEALKLDAETARKIEKLQTQDLDMELADGAVGICGAIEYAKQNNLKFRKIDQTNSSKVNEDTSNVVGYGGWYLTL